jgi:hypothetical protein
MIGGESVHRGEILVPGEDLHLVDVRGSWLE